MKRIPKKLLAFVMAFLLVGSLFPSALAEQNVWNCPDCGRTENKGNYCGGCGHPAPWIEQNQEAETSKSKSTNTVLAAGGYHTVGLKADGTVVAVGDNRFGQCDVSGWRDIVAVAAGLTHTVGLKADGAVVAAGNNQYGQCDVSGWRDIVAVAAGGVHTVGLKADGTVVAVGNNSFGQCDVSGCRDIVAVAAGDWHTVGLKADGTVVAVGSNGYSRCDVSGWWDIVAVAAGYYHTVGLKEDGTVVAVGVDQYGQCDVSGWRDIVAVTAGINHTVGLKADGTVLAVGRNDNGRCDVSGWQDIVAVAAGGVHTVGLKSDGTVVAVGLNDYGQCNVSGWSGIAIPAAESFVSISTAASTATPKPTATPTRTPTPKRTATPTPSPTKGPNYMDGGTVHVGTNRISMSAGKSTRVKFVAPSKGTYYFVSTGNDDTLGRIYSSYNATTAVARDDDSGENKNFQIAYSLNADQIIYIEVGFLSFSKSGIISLNISKFELSSSVKSDQGRVTVSWTDPANNAPYTVSYRCAADSKAVQSSYWAGGNKDASTTYATSFTIDGLIPGKKYRIEVENCNGVVIDRIYNLPQPEEFVDGKLKASSFRISMAPRQKEVSADDETAVSINSLRASDIISNRGSKEYGFRYEINYPELAYERSYFTQIAVTAPNGYLECEVAGVFEYESGYNRYFYMLGDWTFEQIYNKNSTIPTGTWTVDLYFNGMHVNQSTFQVQ